MENKGPIKRHKALVAFSKDHHFGLLLSWKIKQGFSFDVSPDRIKNYILYFFDEDLRYHFQEEEAILFSLLPFEPATKKALADHAEIREMIETMRTHQPAAEDLTRFAAKLEEHIRFEERMLFNEYQSKLTELQLSEIEQTELMERKDIDVNWEDHFWIKTK